MESEKNYYVGLDIGTDSVGYVATDTNYKPLKYNGKAIMGTHLLDPTEENAMRRGFRTARRRLDRKQQRVKLIREIFAAEIGQKDAGFYQRLDCSALFAEDKTCPSKNAFFNDADYQDQDYHKDYPTIHHLICDLMQGTAKQDIRLVYLAVSYLVAHRGHFLNEVDKNDIEGVLDFGRIYDAFLSYFETPIWTCDATVLSDILKKKIGITAKEKELLALLFDGKKPKVTEDDQYNKALIVKLLAGGKVKPAELYLNDAYAEISSCTLSMPDQEFDALLSELGDDGELLIFLKKMYDWSVLAELVPNGRMISESKVLLYEKHKKDLKFLKEFIRKYFGKETYYEVFRASDIPSNYVAYSYHLKKAENLSLIKRKAKKQEFCEYILKIVKDVKVEPGDRAKYEDMIERLNKDVASFMPKQVEGDNRLIPYQLYYVELLKILESAKKQFPFLTEVDENGKTPCDKILATFLFRIPYYVGPLNFTHPKNAWVVRTKEKIYPWNFEEVVDLDQSEEAFIRRMTNQCTYLPGENVIPKNSLLYAKFEVLNEINNLRINGEKIDVETKQQIYTDLFAVKGKVTLKNIRDFLRSRGKLQAEDQLSGMDLTVKSSLKVQIFFRGYLEAGMLCEEDVENILTCKAYSEDSYRFKKWLATRYPQLSEADVKRISNQKFKEFGRLSKKFLCQMEGTNKKTGEVGTIIETLWNTNYNLMQLLSNEFTFQNQVECLAKEYYSENPKTLSEKINEMYLPNAVKRPVIRTLDIMKDIVKVQKQPPTKIFVEMARGATEDQKKKRTVSRRDQILELYKQFKNEEEIDLLRAQLATKDDRELQGETLFLYFMQLGKCMYSGMQIQLEDLGTGIYNVDHIYPRSFVKDDSINNKVLVRSEINGEKSNAYPIAAEIRSKMYGFWKVLKEKSLLSDEKFKRLTRSTEFTESEKWEFINRQLVETRQSTKAVATLLQELYPEAEIVYVKAGLVSEFRQTFGLLKSRTVNDLHHAKDAYLNIAVGNAYHSTFTKKWFSPHGENYSLKAATFFTQTHRPGGVCVWDGVKTLAYVKEIVSKNNIHLTKYALCRHGGFFDQMPVKAGANDGLVPRKKGLDPQKYGGYNKATASFFALIKFETKKEKDLILLPIELMYADRFVSDREFALTYVKKMIATMIHQEPTNIEFPFGMRKIKINTVLELDGFRFFLSGKTGNRLIISSLTSLKIGQVWETYVKRLEAFAEKQKKNPNWHISTTHDKITPEENQALYEIYLQKSEMPLFAKTLCASVSPALAKGKEKFAQLSIEAQVNALLNIGTVFKTGRKGGCDLSALGGKQNAGALSIGLHISNWKKNYTTAYIIDSSASGLYESRSSNLLELL